MRTSGLRTWAVTSMLVALSVSCNRQNQQATRDPIPLNTPEPVPEGPYSDPAATSPVARSAKADEIKPGESADQLQEQGYTHCPPAGTTTPPSADRVEPNSKLAPVDCPPGDPNASTSQIGIPAAKEQK